MDSGQTLPRIVARGKFLYAGREKFWIRGVTYGTFRPDRSGCDYPPLAALQRDFEAIRAADFNTIRTYSSPPLWVLDAAAEHGLRVLVGLPWEQHVTFLDDPRRARDIARRMRAAVRWASDHPAVLGYAIGNEIPAPIVRWHGRRRIEGYLKHLYATAKDEDPAALVTYVNYPTTEYLDLPFLDLVAFNVYLESEAALATYLARLQNVAGDRPLVMAEMGLDSRRHGEAAQAQVLDWQIRTTFAAGCVGAFVFAWTDEWHRGGVDVDDWSFGLTRRDRTPKPALGAVREALESLPLPKDRPWPRVSVVVCSYNGARTIRDTFDGLLELEYPDFEVIVVDDGSTDATAAIARQYPFRLIRTENRGLGAARNTGLAAATGEIVAYTDDDARPDPHWLTYLGAGFMSSAHAGLGGPNLAPPGDGPIAECVANAPGGPIHVLLSDTEAEHIPGCNMAFRKVALEKIGGFDPRFRTAGDDVDVCWRIQDSGDTLGFCPAALVWHHRRNSLKTYWRQQRGYGRAEALLEDKWPEKYNAAGHVTWAGRLYGPARLLGVRPARIYQGTWGTAPFQRLYDGNPPTLLALTAMPEWYLVIGALAVLVALGALWTPLLGATPLLALAVAAPVTLALASARHARFPCAPRSRARRLALLMLTALLHLAQPLARLSGRLRHGLVPWRHGNQGGFAMPQPLTGTVWSERWQPAAAWLAGVEAALREDGARVHRGGDWDAWDLEVRGGLLAGARLLMATEEHGRGRQLLRFRVWPICSRIVLLVIVVFLGLAGFAARDGAWLVAVVLGAGALLLAFRALAEWAGAVMAIRRALRR